MLQALIVLRYVMKDMNPDFGGELQTPFACGLIGWALLAQPHVSLLCCFFKLLFAEAGTEPMEGNSANRYCVVAFLFLLSWQLLIIFVMRLIILQVLKI